MNQHEKISYLLTILNKLKFVLVLFIVYVLILTVASILKHYNLRSFAYDLGIFMQSLWNTIHGKFFYETPDLYWNSSGNYLSVHFSLIMLLFIPLYSIFPCAELLLFLQSIIIGLAGVPLYLLSIRITGDDNFSKVLVLSYYLSPILHAANLYDFHVESFIPLLIFLSAYHLEKGSITKAVLLATSLCFCLYTLCPLVMLLLTFYIIRIKYPDRCIVCSIFCVIFYFYTVANLILPLLGNVPFAAGTITWFPYLGKSWNEILRNIFFSPELLLKSLFHDIQLKIAYWIFLSAPVAFIYLAYPPIILPLSYWLVISFLTTYTPFYTVGWQYPLIVVPLIYVGSIYGYKRLLMRNFSKRNILRKIRNAFLLISLVQFTFSPVLLPLHNIQIQGGGGYDISLVLPPRYYSAKQLFDLIKKDSTASILTTNNLFPHFANSPKVFVWLPKGLVPDYIILDVYDFARFYDIIGGVKFIRQLEYLFSSTHYGIYGLKGGIFILKLNYNETPKFYEPMDIEIGPNQLYTEMLHKTIIFDGIFKPVLKGRITNSSRPVWFGPYMLLPPGEYSLILRLRMNNDCLKRTYIEITSDFGVKRLKYMNVSENMMFDGKWYVVKMNFTLTQLEKYVEVRGWGPENCEIELDTLRLYGSLLLN